MRKILAVALLVASVLLVYSQTTGTSIPVWHWQRCGVTHLENGERIVTYTTGQEVIACDQIFRYETPAYDVGSTGMGTSINPATGNDAVAVSCVLVLKGGNQ